MKKIFILALIFSTKLLAADNIKALNMALDDEYKSFATYQQVIDDFGEIKPFINIIRSEEKHIEHLRPFFEKYSQKVPANPYLGKVDSYSSVKEACQAGVVAEEENVALYDKIYSFTDDSDLIKVFNKLQRASQEKHLRAFRRCLKRMK